MTLSPDDSRVDDEGDATAGRGGAKARSPWLDLRRVAADMGGRRFDEADIAEPHAAPRFVLAAAPVSFTGCSID